MTEVELSTSKVMYTVNTYIFLSQTNLKQAVIKYPNKTVLKEYHSSSDPTHLGVVMYKNSDCPIQLLKHFSRATENPPPMRRRPWKQHGQWHGTPKIQSKTSLTASKNVTSLHVGRLEERAEPSGMSLRFTYLPAWVHVVVLGFVW